MLIWLWMIKSPICNRIRSAIEKVLAIFDKHVNTFLHGFN